MAPSGLLTDLGQIMRLIAIETKSMLPKVFWQVVRKADIQTKYTKRTTDYWSKNYDNFIEVTRDAFKITFASLVMKPFPL